MEKRKLFVILNENTKQYLHSKSNKDIVQCSLEYNSVLIQNLIKNKEQLSEAEYSSALSRLYDNLKVAVDVCKRDINTEDNTEEDKKALRNNSEEPMYANSKTGLFFKFPF